MQDDMKDAVVKLILSEEDLLDAVVKLILNGEFTTAELGHILSVTEEVLEELEEAGGD